MVDRQVVLARVDTIKSSVRRLDQVARLEEGAFLADPDQFAIAEHHLRRALEALFDIGRHILARQGFGRPEDYRDIILKLGEHHVLPKDFVDQIAGMAGYRNRLVHGYADVTPAEIYCLVRQRRKDLLKFCSYVLLYLDRSVKG